MSEALEPGNTLTVDEASPLLSNQSSQDVRNYTDHAPEPTHGGGEAAEGLTKPKVAMAPIVIPMAIGIFLAAMDGTIVVSSYAAIGSELNQLQNTSWIATGYMLTQTSFQPLYGKLSDIFGRKPCLLFAYIVFALGCLLCGLARDMNELIAARAFAGIGGGGMTTIVSIIMSDIVPLRSRGTWQGILNIVFATGSASGAPLGGFLADTIGWRWAFLVQVPITILAITTVSLAVKLSKSSAESQLSSKLKRVDFSGAMTLVLAVFFLLFGLDRGGNVAWNTSLTISSLIAFVIFFTIFGIIELEIASEPFAPRRIIFNRSLIASYLVNFFGMASGLSLVFHVSLYFQAVRGKSASDAGLWLLWSISGSVVGSLSGGMILQATGKFYWPILVSYISLFIGTSVVTLMTGVVEDSLPGVAVGLVLASLGNGSGITTSLVALIATAGPEDQAIATAVSYLFRSLGSVLGISVGSTLVQDTLRKSLRSKLLGQDIEELVRRVRESLSYVDELDPFTQVIVRESYAQAVHATLYFTIIMAFCSVLSAIFIKERPLSSRN